MRARGFAPALRLAARGGAGSTVGVGAGGGVGRGIGPGPWAGLLACAVLALGGVPACTAPPARPLEVETGPDAEVTPDGLHRAKRSELAVAYLKPDADFSRYSKVLLAPLTVYYKDQPKRSRQGSSGANFELTPRQMERLKNDFHAEFAKEIERGDVYRLVESPGRDVLRLNPMIIDLVVKVPTDQPAASSHVFVSSLGLMTLVLEARDSFTGEILARGADRREVRRDGWGDMQWSNPAANDAEVRRTIRIWARILRRRLDQWHSPPPPATSPAPADAAGPTPDDPA